MSSTDSVRASVLRTSGIGSDGGVGVRVKRVEDKLIVVFGGSGECVEFGGRGDGPRYTRGELCACKSQSAMAKLRRYD